MTARLHALLHVLLHTLAVCVCEPTQSWADRELLNSQDSHLTYQSQEAVFQLVSTPLSFPQALRHCQGLLSTLTTRGHEDEEAALHLLRKAGARGPVWVRDPVPQDSVQAPRPHTQNVVLPGLSFPAEAQDAFARVGASFGALSAVSVCVQVQWGVRGELVSTVFSYAAPVFNNEFQLRGRADRDGKRVLLALIVHGQHRPYKARLPVDGEWHLVCVTWRRADGFWAIYVDGERRDSGSGLDTARDLHGDGILIVGQDQDSFGGNFTEPFVGNVTALNVWDVALEEPQVRRLNACLPLTGAIPFVRWEERNLTVHPAVRQTDAKLYCPAGLQKQREGQSCRILDDVTNPSMPQYNTSLCTNTLPFICKMSKVRYVKMKAVMTAQISKPTPFIQNLLQHGLTVDDVRGGAAGGPGWEGLSHVMNVSEQVVEEAKGPLEAQDTLALVQILAQAANTPPHPNHTHTQALQLGHTFLSLVDHTLSQTSAQGWHTIREVVGGPMAVVQSVDRMLANLNPLLLSDTHSLQMQSGSTRLRLQQKALSEGSTGSTFCGSDLENSTGQDCISVPSQNMQKLHNNGFRRVTVLNTWYGSFKPLLSAEEDSPLPPPARTSSLPPPATKRKHRYLSTILGSAIISSTVLGDGQQVSMGVQFNLQHKAQVSAETRFDPICAFWDFNLIPENGGSWSTRGCEVTSSRRDSTSCYCNHTTNFAVLLQVYETQWSQENESGLEILTLVGCGVSLCCLSFTLVLFVAVGVPKSDRTTVHKNLIGALATAQLLLLLSDWAIDSQACVLVTALLHVFFLAGFCWMLVEGLLLWSKVVSVNLSERHRMKLYYTLGWGVPVVIVAVTMAICRDAYSAESRCWLRLQSHAIWAFVAPALCVLAVNAVVLCRVVMVTVSSARRRAKMLTPSSASKPHALDLTWAATRPVLILLPVLGVTWLCGVLVHLSVTLAYIFISLNAFQGLYIFLVYAVYNSEVRNAIKRIQEKRRALSFTNCSHPSGFLPSQRAPPLPSPLDSSEASSPGVSSASNSNSLVFKNESFRKNSYVSFSMKPTTENQVVLLTGFKPSGC